MDLDNYKGESATAAQKTEQLNTGLRIISRHIHLFNPKVTFTPTAASAVQNIQNTSTPVVSQKVIRPYSVMMNGVKLSGPDGNVGVWPYGQFIQEYPAWELADDGTVYRAVIFNEGKLLLNPAPTTAVVTAAQNFIAGTVYAAPLVNGSGDSTEPDLPADLHEALCLLTAAIAADPQIAAEEALRRVQSYNQRAYQALMDTRQMNLNASSMFAMPLTDERDSMSLT